MDTNIVAQKLYGVNNFQPFMNKCLGILRGISLLDQLKRQKVREIIFQPLFRLHGGLTTIEENSCELAMYLDTKATSYDESLFTVGHEIGHTFHPFLEEKDFGLLRMYAQTLPAVLEEEDVLERVDKRNEDFADAFAVAWLKQGKNRNFAEIFISTCHPGRERTSFISLR